MLSAFEHVFAQKKRGFRNTQSTAVSGVFGTCFLRLGARPLSYLCKSTTTSCAEFVAIGSTSRASERRVEVRVL